MGRTISTVQWKRGIGGVVVAGGLIAGVMTGSATATADTGQPAATGTSTIADDGCTFSSVGGSCSDPGPVGNALIAFRNWLKSMGYGTGSSSGTAYFF
ncbi:hypothetical protein DFR70_11372 [Nocardia tenerifensis]|uniref:Uncharacterized protein n=1 Tax=Nocardia tenerifensis TaxID=228006 RepID=A0A318JXU1_9NOCA|nr:hypothetical protein [Nocardia tenerifensis]PXX58737.1 hypothetical protein DFR70_11372 [Nocardia tenerifensis]